MPCLWPRPERGRITAASPGSSRWIASPVGISSALPGRERQRRVEAGAQVQPGGTRGGVGRQRKLACRCAHRGSVPSACGRSAGMRSRRRSCRAGVPLAATCAPHSARRSAPRVPRQRQLVGRAAGRGAPLRQSTSSALSSQSNALSWPTSLAAIMSRFFFRSLARAYCSTASRLGGEAHHERPAWGAPRPWRARRRCAPARCRACRRSS